MPDPNPKKKSKKVGIDRYARVRYAQQQGRIPKNHKPVKVYLGTGKFQMMDGSGHTYHINLSKMRLGNQGAKDDSSNFTSKSQKVASQLFKNSELKGS